MINKVCLICNCSFKNKTRLLYLCAITCCLWLAYSIYVSSMTIKMFSNKNVIIYNDIDKYHQDNIHIESEIISLDTDMKNKENYYLQLINEEQQLQQQLKEQNQLITEYETLNKQYRKIVDQNTFHEYKYQQLINKLREIESKYKFLKEEYSQLTS